MFKKEIYDFYHAIRVHTGPLINEALHCIYVIEAYFIHIVDRKLVDCICFILFSETRMKKKSILSFK